MAVAPVSSTQQVTQSAFGLDFQSLLKIILTELTYQDPLKPVDNYEFVSQLGQFSQLQLSQTLNDNVTQLLASWSSGRRIATLRVRLQRRTARHDGQGIQLPDLSGRRQYHSRSCCFRRHSGRP